MKYLFLKLIIIICAFNLQLNAQTYFNRLYDYNGTQNYNNAASSLIELYNGDFFIGGVKFLSNFGALHFIRINSHGDTVLVKRFPKINCAYSTAIGNSLIRCFDGNLVIAGAYTDSNSTHPDAILIKLTENGDTLWTKTYGGANFDNANTVSQTPDSGFVLMGVTQSFSIGPASDFYLIKTDKDGNFQWQRTYGTTATEECLSGQITLDGGFILSGHQNNQFHVVKTDNVGNMQWQQTYAGTSGSSFIKQLTDSSYILTGGKVVTGFAGEAYMIKINKTGGIIWQNHYGSASVNDWFYTIPIILSDGSMVIGGQQMLGSQPLGMLVKTDGAGNQQWLRTYYANANNANYVYDVKHTSDNGFILTGSGNLTGQDAWVVKVDSNGCEYAGCNVGIEELRVDGGEIEIYPNPATNEITLATNQQLKTIHIYNVLGEEVLKLERIATSEKAIDISAWNAGVYFVEVETEKGIVRRKFVKE